MKYIHIVQFHLMSGGGVGSVLTDLCEAMAKQSNETYIISLFQRKGIVFQVEQAWAKEKGMNVLLMQEKETDSSWKVFRNLKRTIKQLSKEEECCLFLHLKMGVLAGIVASLGMKNVKRVEVYHSGYMGYKLLAFFARPFIRHYISVSKEAKQQLINWFHIKESKIDVVYNGVDVEHIRNVAKIEETLNGQVNLVSVGRLSFEKGFKTSIEAYANLRESKLLSNSTYTMIGDGVQRQEAEGLAKGHVTFTGVIPRDTVYKRIAECDIMVLPSLWEGNSILMLEVLSLGKPMVLTDIPSFREVLEFAPLRDDEQCRLEWFGVVFHKENLESCKEALRIAYENIAYFKTMTDRIMSIGDKFSVEEQANKYFRIAADCS